MYINKKLFNNIAITYSSLDKGCNDVQKEIIAFILYASGQSWSAMSARNLAIWGMSYADFALSGLFKAINAICTGTNIEHSRKRSQIQSALNEYFRKIRCLIGFMASGGAVLPDVGVANPQLSYGPSFIGDQIQNILNRFKGITGEQLCNKITPLLYPETNPAVDQGGDVNEITLTPQPQPIVCPKPTREDAEALLDGVLGTTGQILSDDAREELIVAILAIMISGATLAAVIAGLFASGVAAAEIGVMALYGFALAIWAAIEDWCSDDDEEIKGAPHTVEV